MVRRKSRLRTSGGWVGLPSGVKVRKVRLRIKFVATDRETGEVKFVVDAPSRKKALKALADEYGLSLREAGQEFVVQVVSEL